MKKSALLGFAFCAMLLVVATSGAPGSDNVSSGETDVLEIESTADAAGVYASTDAKGEIKIILTEENENIEGEGVNDEARTDIGPVFTIQNVHDLKTTTNVWIKHDSQAAEFYADRCGTCIDSPDGAVILQPGESVSVSLRVDTRGMDEEVLLSGVTVVANLDPDEGTSESEGDNRVSGVGGASLETPTLTPTPGGTGAADGPEEPTETSTPQPTKSTEIETESTVKGDDDPIEEAALADSLTPALLGVMAVLVLAGAYTYRRYA